jgi:poly(glycerol-phosphate) alpha-glucosyltransferase
MKVAMTTGSLSRNAGGLFESVRAVGKELSELGVGVSVYGLRDQNWGRDEEAWEPLSAYAFSFVGPRALAWSPDMDAALDEARPDLVALQGLWQYSSIATRRQWRRNGTPYVISPRGMLDKWALANSRWKKVLAAFVFENAVLSDAACLHALCESEADAIRAYGLRQRIEVIPNGVDLPEMGKAESRNAGKVKEGKKRLLFLGRIHPKKGLLGALQAWAELRNSPSAICDSAGWQFVIAGWDQGGHEGELKALCTQLKLRIADRGEVRTEGKAENLKAETLKTLDSGRSTLDSADVLFFGPAFGEEKETLLRSADGFVLPSFSEGLPMSVLEAWAYGLPVVMTPECNLPEGFASHAALEIRSGEGSFQGSDFSFQHGLRALIEMSEAQRWEMGTRGRKLVEDRFNWQKVAARMKEVYESLL